MENLKVERFLSRFIKFYIAFIAFVTILNSYIFFFKHDPWAYGDWLINYQNGFVRRGLVGEVIYQISSHLPVNIGVIVFLLHALLYGVMFYFSYRLLKLQEKLLPYVFLIFSPFIFNFQVFDPGGGFRKEIIYLAILTLVVYWAKTEKKFSKKFNRKFFIILSIYPLAIFSHEMLFFFMPYLYVAYFYVNDVEKKNIRKLILFTMPSILAFLIVLIFGKANAKDVYNIYLSLGKVGYSISGGAIGWLDKDVIYSLNRVYVVSFLNHYYIYFVIVLLSFVAFIPIRNKIVFLLKNKLNVFFIMISLGMSLSLFLVGTDWGRWIYIHLFSIFLITLLIKNPYVDRKKNIPLYAIFNNKKILILFVLLYSLFWRLPPYYYPGSFIPTKMKNLPVLSYVKPFTEIVSYYNKQLKKTSK